MNYGVPDDYEELARRGIDVAGKIVLARYGGSWRGIKPKVAAEQGAIGCLIYSDPRDDGYVRGDVYPIGAYRMDRGVQRGSVADMPLFPGDPLTPNAGATEAAERLDLDDAPTLTTIPVLPISYADAEPGRPRCWTRREPARRTGRSRSEIAIRTLRPSAVRRPSRALADLVAQ